MVLVLKKLVLKIQSNHHGANDMTNKKIDWFMRRHDYRPEAIGLTEPQQELPVDTSGVSSGIPSDIGVKIDRTNHLLEEMLRIYAHDKLTEYDIDISDSVSYDLSSSEAAEISYTVPSDYVMLLQEYFTTLTGDTTYYVYLDDELFQYSSDMSFVGAMGIAIAPQVTFKMYVLNTYSATQSYISSIRASIRRVAHWDYPMYSYKKPV